jgi:hypothetical protein
MTLRAEAFQLKSQALAKLQAADLVEHAETLRQVLAQASAELQEAEQDPALGGDAVADALAAERAAEDRARQVADHARLAREAAELAEQEHADPAKIVDLQVRARLAVELTEKASADLAAARTARQACEAIREDARGVLAEARTRHRAAKEAEAGAESTLRPSTATLMAAWSDFALRFDELTAAEQGVVRLLAQACAQITGADRAVRVSALEHARQERRDEFDRALATIPAPTSGNIAMPLAGQRDPRADSRR